MSKKIFILIASMLMLLAYVNVASASGWSGYQPELPDSLK
ncbi:MAG: cyclic lactone autoinducer peptide [Clostridia bacterium]|nr:cyclic lactone autoinducer peptide [Clostridia bacterium]